MTNEQLTERLLAQAKFNDALDETCRALMEAAADKLRGEPAASTPVAGDAVAALPAAWRAHAERAGSTLSAWWYIRELEAALAQDHTSQGY